MNEYIAKKFGEVLAFAEVGKESLNKGKEGFQEALGDKIHNLAEINEEHIRKINELALKNEVLDTVKEKSQATGEKLRKMRDLYIKEGDWEDPAELMEWSGFFEGAALVHWSLISGAGEKTNSDDIKTLAKEGLDFHTHFLDEIKNSLFTIGKLKA